MKLLLELRRRLDLEVRGGWGVGMGLGKHLGGSVKITEERQ